MLAASDSSPVRSPARILDRTASSISRCAFTPNVFRNFRISR